MHLNRGCHHPDLSNLFTREDVSEEVGAFLPQVPREVSAQLRMLPRCHRRRLSTPDLSAVCPTRVRSSDVVTTWCQAARPTVTGLWSSSTPGLADALAALRTPVMHLDFETINPAIPVWPGCRPYDQVPVQFSVHAEPTRRGGAATHFQWLADGPRGPAAGALARARPGARRSGLHRCLQPTVRGGTPPGVARRRAPADVGAAEHHRPPLRSPCPSSERTSSTQGLRGASASSTWLRRSCPDCGTTRWRSERAGLPVERWRRCCWGQGRVRRRRRQPVKLCWRTASGIRRRPWGSWHG